MNANLFYPILYSIAILSEKFSAHHGLYNY